MLPFAIWTVAPTVVEPGKALTVGLVRALAFAFCVLALFVLPRFDGLGVFSDSGDVLREGPGVFFCC